MLNKIERDFPQDTRENLSENPIERIKYLLQATDHLEIHFPSIHQQLSTDSFSLDRPSAPISAAAPSHVKLSKK